MNENENQEEQLSNDVAAKKHDELVTSDKSTQKLVDLDASLKQALSFKVVLSRILHDCTEEFCNMDFDTIEKCIEGEPSIDEVYVHADDKAPANGSDKIKGSRNEDKIRGEGTVVYDIVFDVRMPNTTGGSGQKEAVKLTINIEAQNDANPGYNLLKRGMYYCSRLISAQNQVEFTNSHYEKIHKVYSIWICSNPKKMVDKNSILRYNIVEQVIYGNPNPAPKDEYDLLTIMMINLDDYHKDQKVDTLKMLSLLIREIKRRVLSIQEIIRILKEELNISDSRLEERVKKMCTFAESILEEGIERGVKQGFEQGIEKGVEKGALKQKIQTIVAMKKEGLSYEVIARIMKITIDEVKQITAEANAPVLA